MNDVTALTQDEVLKITETDHFELSQIFSAQQGVAELILYSGDERFLPEMRTENMAAILSVFARYGERVLKSAEPETREAKAA